MKNPLAVLRALGVGALLLFLLMVAILQWKIAPYVAFLPQATLGAYTDSALVELGDELRTKGLDRLYKAVLLSIDFLFITIFGLWVMLVHMMRSAVSWRFWGVAIAALFMALDFGEDMMLAICMGLVTKGNLDPATLTAEVSAVHWVTLAKYAIFALCLMSAFIASRKRG
ncbi:MAG: hypothetical protein P8P65_07385 [Planktotalea sp.]|uniref:hypothetical protein n=1 Tax=Planktotalea sp. TaxID=2029877 RepID=UPI0026268278|nr:hypothetical protein [Planktotalea sp.]MDG1076461.1 hypothetical protein [Planktotalea sp.]MDG1083106.1 hypothetical protein [Planktotalea sp.]